MHFFCSVSHLLFLNDVFSGDGAGVGKGRTIAGIIYENYLHGRKRALWYVVQVLFCSVLGCLGSQFSPQVNLVQGQDWPDTLYGAFWVDVYPAHLSILFGRPINLLKEK